MKPQSFLPFTILVLALSACDFTGQRSFQLTGQRSQSSHYLMPGQNIQAEGIPEIEKSRKEEYSKIKENSFVFSSDEPVSTFSIDVDEASYSNTRRFIKYGYLPPADAVRIEEFINYFDYDYPAPAAGQPFHVYSEIGNCPWNEEHKLVHIGLQGKVIPIENLPPSNLVFLIDISGSMLEPDKLDLVKESLILLTKEIKPKDKISIVTYAGTTEVALPSTSGSETQKIISAIEKLKAGGSTAGGSGIQLAYAEALRNFIAGGNNRVILATDGDFNVGVSSEEELVKLIEEERKKGIYLSVLGVGTGNYMDNKMQQLADNGNGNHSYIDNLSEAKKVLIREFGSTLFTIAKDVKIQVEFNPERVLSYRLIGYENRMLAKKDFEDDKKDAGELGSGHTVTAIYEIIPAGEDFQYTTTAKATGHRSALMKPGDLMSIELRYKKPDEDTSQLISSFISDAETQFKYNSDNFRFSAAVAEFGLLLRNSQYKEGANYEQVIQLASLAKGQDAYGYRSEFIGLVKKASSIKPRKNRS